MDFTHLAEFRNTHNPYAQRIGIVVEEIGPGYARAAKTIGPEDMNPAGVPHGGVYFSLADTACGSASASREQVAYTTSVQYPFLRSAKEGDRVTACAREIRRGKTICVYEIRVTDQQDQLLGWGSCEFFRVE